MEPASCNELLFQLLLQSIAEIHDTEVQLTEAECNQFLQHVLARPRSCYYSAPFTEEAIDDIPVVSSARNDSFKAYTIPDLKKDADEQDDENVKAEDHKAWKCFVKGVSSTHVSLSFIPASYNDLRRIIFPSGFALDAPSKSVRFKSMSVQSYSEVSSPDSKHFMTIIQEAERFSEGKGSRRGSPKKGSDVQSLPSSSQESPRTRIKRQEELDVEDELEKPRKTGSLTLPVYIYDCPLTVLVDQALFPHDGIRLRDIFHDYTYKMDDTIEYNSKQISSITVIEAGMSASTSKYESPEPKSEDSDYPVDRHQLKLHCNLIKMAFAKSFVDGVFR